MKTVLLDCDGVLSDFLGGLLEEVNSRGLGNDFKSADCDQWDIGEAFGLSWSDVLDPICERKGFCANLRPLPGSIEAVCKLRAAGHEVFVVTSPFDTSPFWMVERAAWLREHFNIDKDHVIHASTKRIVSGDVLVDDKPETIAEWSKAWPSGTAILWDAPYNQHVANHCGFRVYCWDHVLELVGQ